MAKTHDIALMRNLPILPLLEGIFLIILIYEKIKNMNSRKNVRFVNRVYAKHYGEKLKSCGSSIYKIDTGFPAPFQHFFNCAVSMHLTGNCMEEIKPNQKYYCKHIPTGEDWVILGISKDKTKVCAAGYPASIANIIDCKEFELVGDLTQKELDYRNSEFGFSFN